MSHGKKVCKILKEIRHQIAEKNDISLLISECHFHGECKGTCPKCEAEVSYLEKELNKRRQLGKAVAVAGISLGVAGAFTGCGTSTQENSHTSEREVLVDMVEIPDSLLNIPPPPLIATTIGFIPPEITHYDGMIEEGFPFAEDNDKIEIDIDRVQDTIKNSIDESNTIIKNE